MIRQRRRVVQWILKERLAPYPLICHHNKIPKYNKNHAQHLKVKKNLTSLAFQRAF